jgi:hypothetical protein
MANRTSHHDGGFNQGDRSLMRRISPGWLFGNPVARYAVLALAAIGRVIAALTLLASIMVEDWSQREIDLRSRLCTRRF